MDWTPHQMRNNPLYFEEQCTKSRCMKGHSSLMKLDSVLRQKSKTVRVSDSDSDNDDDALPNFRHPQKRRKAWKDSHQEEKDALKARENRTISLPT